MAAVSEVGKSEDELLLHVSPEEEKEEQSVLEESKVPGSEEEETDISTIRYPSTAAKLEDQLPNNRIKRYVNNKGNFITGIDINSEESVKKKATRHERFGTEAVETSKEEIKINERAKRFGIISTSTGEIIRYTRKLPEIPEGEARPEGLVVYGTNDMSTQHVFNVFTEYGPKHIEWINDKSCVVVWEDSSSAQRAFLGKGAWPVLEEGVSEGSSPLWRKGPGGLLLRIATTADVKKKGSRAKSDYYKKYGDPNSRNRERRKRPRNNDLRRRLEEKKQFEDDDEEMETNEVKQMKLEEEEEEENGRGDDKMEVSTDTLISDQIIKEGAPPLNDLRHKLGTSKKRQQLKSRLGPFPSVLCVGVQQRATPLCLATPLIKMAADLYFLMCSVLFFCPLCVWSEDRKASLLIIMNSIIELEVKQNHDNINEWRQEITQFNNIQLLVPMEQFSSIHIHSLAPLMGRVYSNYKDIDWFLFVRPDVKINFNNLQSFLLQHEGPKSKPYFIGYALKDDMYSIIHHFIPAGSLAYPSTEGFLMSNSVMKRVSKNVKSFKPSFTIDPSYELSLFLKYMKSPSLSDMFPSPPPPSSSGVLLSHSQRFCVAGNHGNDCVIESSDSGLYCSSPVSKDNVFFAIKTCEKYHKERIPIQFRTWTAPAAGLRLQYYSDVTDSNYRTVSIGLPNTEKGHCAKLLEIFRVSLNNHEFDWLVIADDDTLISVPRLLSFLGCYDSSVSMVIGEVYGYRLGEEGYLYPTAGSGVILSRPAVQALIQSNIKCPSPDYPDDMFLGAMIRSLKIPLLHTPLLHQNQPGSYNKLLINERALSFHRFKPEDPIMVYKEYLTTNNNNNNNNNERTEL